jgi:metallo-beta-lactamase family protein
MEIKFLGGVESVTGSCFILNTKNSEVMIDCGLFQGSSFLEEKNFKFIEANPDAVFITHAHLDHIGRLPYLYKNFKKKPKIISTKPTKELAKIILLDSLKILKEKSKILNKEPIYQEEYIEILLDNWITFSYGEKISFKDLEVCFFDAGHILGSSFILFSNGKENIVFSGDLGHQPSNLLRPLESLPKTDFLVLESTYGGKLHEDINLRREKLEDIIEETVKDKGVLLIPIFAIEKAQEIIFEIYNLISEYKVPKIPIFLDSPLAFLAFQIYKDYFDYLNQNARAFFDKINHIFKKDFVIPILEHEDSFRIWDFPNPKIILAGSGMSNGGRILRHEKKYLPFENTKILIVGFQAEGSLGRQIVEGKKEVEIEGELVKVNAKVSTLYSFSLHADQAQILNWIFPQRLNLKSIFLVHGEEDQKKELKNKIVDSFAIEVIIPKEGDVIQI